jgi:hypothetical protein
MFPIEVIFYSHYSFLLNDDQLVQVQCNKPTMSRYGSLLVVQCHSSNLNAKSIHRYPSIKEKENNWTPSQEVTMYHLLEGKMLAIDHIKTPAYAVK